MRSEVTTLDIAKIFIDKNNWTEDNVKLNLESLADTVIILPRHQISDLHIYFNSKVNEKLKINDLKQFRKLIKK